MPHPPLYILNARLLSLDPPLSTREPHDSLAIIPAADILIEHGVISRIHPAPSDSDPHVPNPAPLPPPPGATIIDARGGVVLPAFVDCHTHLCWAGSRLDEWERKLAGASYLQLLAAGGGIMSTVRAVRAASQHQLAELTLHRLALARSLGTTTIEIKSGYGLSTEHELKVLRAISDAASRWPGTVVPTALLAHAIDPDAPSPAAFVDRTIQETLPAVHAEFPGVAIDAYCEQGAWSVADCARLFQRAVELGHPVRVHADQFNSLGMVREAIRLGARSVDHLEATTDDDWRELARSDAAAVVLPGCGFHLDNRYASAGTYLAAFHAPASAAGTPAATRIPRLCIATNANPGSAPCMSMPMMIALAVRHCGLSAASAIVAATLAPARLLGFTDRGLIAVGARADLAVLNTTDERELAYWYGDASRIRHVISAGTVL